MAKRDVQIKQRSDFCKLALSNPQKAGEKLEAMAESLKHCRNTSDTIKALCEIFAVTESTVFKDLTR